MNCYIKNLAIVLIIILLSIKSARLDTLIIKNSNEADMYNVQTSLVIFKPFFSTYSGKGPCFFSYRQGGIPNNFYNPPPTKDSVHFTKPIIVDKYSCGDLAHSPREGDTFPPPALNQYDPQNPRHILLKTHFLFLWKEDRMFRIGLEPVKEVSANELKDEVNFFEVFQQSKKVIDSTLQSMDKIDFFKKKDYDSIIFLNVNSENLRLALPEQKDTNSFELFEPYLIQAFKVDSTDTTVIGRSSESDFVNTSNFEDSVFNSQVAIDTDTLFKYKPYYNIGGNFSGKTVLKKDDENFFPEKGIYAQKNAEYTKKFKEFVFEYYFPRDDYPYDNFDYDVYNYSFFSKHSEYLTNFFSQPKEFGILSRVIDARAYERQRMKCLSKIFLTKRGAGTQVYVPNIFYLPADFKVESVNGEPYNQFIDNYCQKQENK